MKKNILMVICLIMLIMVFTSCTDFWVMYENSWNSSTTIQMDPGFSLRFKSKDLMDRGAQSLKVEITHSTTGQKYDTTLNISGSYVTAVFNDIETGSYNIAISIYDESNVVIGQGNGSITVSANTTTNTVIDVEFEGDDPDPETGSITIGINIIETEPNPSSNKGEGLYIGINEWDEQNQLYYTDDDAEDLNLVFDKVGLNGNTITGRVLKNQIITGLSNIEKNTDKLFVFSYSGHGYYNPSTQQSNICFSDYYGGFDDEFMTASELKNLLESLNRPILIIIDACQCGEFSETSSRNMEMFYETFINTFSIVTSRGYPCMILAASDTNEYSYELGNLKNGVFSYYISVGLGMSDEYWTEFNNSYDADLNNDRSVTFSELYNYSHQSVINRVDDQTPQRSLGNDDFKICSY